MKVLNYKDLENYRRSLSEIPAEVFQTVSKILRDVKKNGDEAVIEYTKKFDRVEAKNFELFADEAEFAAAEKEVMESNADVFRYFLNAAENVRRYHEYQIESGFRFEDRGNMLGQKVSAVPRAGLYVPAGISFLPSSFIMNIIPALVAGVPKITVAAPPRRDGTAHPMLLALAKNLGVTKVLKAGGAQAIGAMAYGTETVQPVYKITGPGNNYVAVAKQQVSGLVGIDSIAGPSEAVIFADESANPQWAAIDLLSQAEHTGDNASFLVSTSSELIDKVNIEIEKLLQNHPRKKMIAKSLSEYSFAVKVENLDEGFDMVNRFAPEHIEVILDLSDEEIIDRIETAGALFIGSFTSVPAGDYYVGPNHVLPTSGTAVFSSPLGVYDFLKRTSIIRVGEDYLKNYGHEIAALARYEGLEAHAQSIEMRTKE